VIHRNVEIALNLRRVQIQRQRAARSAVLPYYATRGRTAKTSRAFHLREAVADLLETAGASRALTLDLHAPQIQGYFDVPVDHLYGSPVLVGTLPAF